MAGIKKAVTPKGVKKAPLKAAVNSRPVVSRRQPDITRDVKAAVVDEIPPSRVSTGRRMRYAVALAAIRQEVGAGRPVRLARFVGSSGAATVKRELERGNRPVDGDVADWQFDARRLEDGGSVLFATLKSGVQ